MMFVSEARVKKELMIRIGDKAFQPPKKILAKDQLLDLAGLDPKQYEIILIDGEGKAYTIDSD